MIKFGQKLKLCELGLKGEKEIEFELKNSNIGMYVLHDINMKYEDLTAQIDYIVITPASMYFIECKNLVGNIRVNSRGEFIREYIYNKRKVKEGIYSPIRQAERHIEIFKKIWNSKNTKLINKLQMRNFDKWCKYIVVMTNPKSILDIKSAPKEIKNKIIRSDNLVKYLQNDVNNTDKDMRYTEKEMKDNAIGIMNNYNESIDRDYEQELRKWLQQNSILLENSLNKIDDSRKDNIAELLKKELKDFRRVTSTEKNIPAYYIFNNDELEKLVKYKPKNIKELKNLKILSDIKIKVHGKKIVEIMNKKSSL
ncbi:MAG TPA: NERD domain-containing protein [Candidatus Scatovivens faecipullorum]|nr:NERD domain-containing protein [Candidatus Scatovivens faecipullorum]